MERKNLRILLIQARHDEVLETEFECFVKVMKLESSQFKRVNVFDKLPISSDLDNVHAVILGGSGSYCVSERKIPQKIDALCEIVRVVFERAIPLIGICFGSHIITTALGGVVEHNLEKKEVGTFEIQLLENAKNDPMFCNLSDTMLVQQGHKDGSVILPKQAIPFATSTLWKYQAYKIYGKPIYAVQFHPELSEEDVRKRLAVYIKEYFGERDDEFERLQTQIRPSKESSELLTRFIDNIVIPRWETLEMNNN